MSVEVFDKQKRNFHEACKVVEPLVVGRLWFMPWLVCIGLEVGFEAS